MASSIAKSTKTLYKQAFDKYALFAGSSQNLFPISVSSLANFVAHLHLSSFKASTITSLIAGLSYFHDMLSLPNPTNHILIKKLLKGASKLNSSPDIRLPMSCDMLVNLVSILHRICDTRYERIMFSSMVTLAFHALLRVGEYTRTGKTDQHTLLRNSVELFYTQSVCFKIQVTIPHYKRSSLPVTLSFKASADTTICPVFWLDRYLKIRCSRGSRCLYVNAAGHAISSYLFGKIFREGIEDMGLNVAVYKPHSLRIGGATLAHERNYTDAQIESLGRWHSKSYRRYIRVPVLSASK